MRLGIGMLPFPSVIIFYFDGVGLCHAEVVADIPYEFLTFFT
jgi:hypothetical protein